MSNYEKTLNETLVSALWREMTQNFGHRWTNSYGESDQGNTWGKGLAGMTATDLGRGIRRCIEARMEWPPSLPEFAGLCTPSSKDLGLPDTETAYRAACNSDWSIHPAVYHAAKKVGTWKLGHEAEAFTRPLFIKAWNNVIEMVRRGEPIDQPAPEMLRIAGAPESKEKRMEMGRAHVAQIRAILRGEVSA